MFFSLLKPKEPLILAKTTEKRTKLRMKIAKGAGGPGNFVLVQKNNFLFFEKGIGMKSKPNQKALLGNRLRIEQEIDNSVASIENSRSQSNVLNLLEGNSLDNTKIQGSLPKLKYVPSAKDSNHKLDHKRRNLKKVGKIVDPCKQEVNN